METNTDKNTKPSNKKFLIIFIIIIIIGGGFGIYKYIQGQAHETTDDAQVERNLNPIIPRVGGYIDKVYVKDNQFVKKGDTLFTIQPADYELHVEEAKAALLATENSLEVSIADVGAAGANIAISDATIQSNTGSIEAAEIKATQAINDYERYNNLYKNHSITKQQYEQALTAKLEAEKQVEVLKKQRNASNSQKQAVISKTNVANKQTSVAQANIERAKATLKSAELNLSYTVVTAAIDGQVSNIRIQEGQLVSQGQSLFYIIDNTETWVVANFKETQLNKIRTGQKVEIKIDAFPNDILEGTVESFSPATGSKFSLLPPDNATGNFVKTVQRLPVKIILKENNKPELIQMLRPGMNADVDVFVK